MARRGRSIRKLWIICVIFCVLSYYRNTMLSSQKHSAPGGGDYPAQARPPPHDILQRLVMPGKPLLRRAVSQRAGPEGLIIVPAVVDKGYTEMAHNFFLTSIKPLHLEARTLFMCVDEAACAEARGLGLPAITYRAANRAESGLYDSRAFVEKAMMKHFIVYEILLMGFSVLLTDLDMYWFKSPVDTVAVTCPRCDFVIQQEADVGLNIGFMVVRPTRSSLLLYEIILRRIIRGTGDGAQELFMNVVFHDMNQRLLYQTLDSGKFPDGSTYFEVSDRLFHHQNPCHECYIVHNNWVYSVEAKRFRFREHRMWAVDTDGYYSDPNRKYIHYDNGLQRYGRNESVAVMERDALYSALAIGEALGRIVILPPYFHDSSGQEVPLQGVLLIKNFDKAYDGLYRESSFQHNKLVPDAVKKNVCGNIIIKSNSYSEGVSYSKYVYMPADPDHGATDLGFRFRQSFQMGSYKQSELLHRSTG